MVVEVPWRIVPVSEPVLPGEESSELRRQRGYRVYVPALISVIADVTTTEARRLVDAGDVSIDGETVTPAFVYVKPGALVKIAPDRAIRLGPEE
jgi:hypothetical protein